jgi:hypothetical protein
VASISRNCFCPWVALVAPARTEATSFGERFWLDHLVEHFWEFIAAGHITDNTVYIVSLGLDAMVDGGTHTWIGVVEIDRCCFHPMGGSGWPVEPPNYIGFRYHGKLQSVHHIDASDGFGRDCGLFDVRSCP